MTEPSVVCVHCGQPIENICGLWGHIVIDLKNPHIPEPKDAGEQ